MRWSKIKSIIILLLIIVNASLLVMVGQRRWQNEQNQRETRQRVIAIMEKNGISFLPAEVPGELELTDRRVILTAAGEAEAQTLVGDITDIQTSGPRTVYTGTAGTVTSSTTGALEATFLPGAYLAGADMAAQSQELLARLGVQTAVLSREEEDGHTIFHYVQLWNGVPVPEWTATLTWGSEGLERVSLRRLAGEEEPTTAETTIDAATALARFLEALNREGYVCSQVTDMYAGYATSGTGTVTLRPTWYVETDTSPWRFAVDGVTGAVTVVE